MKIAIDCVHYPISLRISSHRSSWARYWKWALQVSHPNAQIDILGRDGHDKWADYDEVYFYQGMEWNGKLNLAGGISDYTLERLRTYAKTSFKKAYSIDVEMPDYYELMKGRKIDDPALKEDHDITVVTLPESRSIVLGDSHALSVMDSPSGEFVRVYRTDFKTLNGALNLGLANVQQIDWNEVDKMTLFFGMIDLRHHVMRHGGFTAIDKLMERYEENIRLFLDDEIKVELVEMYPMPPNSRKLPKSGFFEGEPYAGTIEERVGCVDYFNTKLEDIADRLGLGFYKQPDIIKLDDGTIDTYFMEKPRSVHMSPEFYRFDLEAGKTREW